MLEKVKKYCRFQKLRMQWKKDNKHNYTYPTCLFDKNNVVIGNETYGPIQVHTFPNVNSKLVIGDFCSIGQDVLFLLGGEHSLEYFSTYPFREKVIHTGIDTLSKGDIVIDDDVWIGSRVSVLSGVHIGRGAVIATGAVVTKDVPPYAIVGGVPAKVIKYRFNETIINELMKVDFSRLTKEMVISHKMDLYERVTDISQLAWLPKK